MIFSFRIFSFGIFSFGNFSFGIFSSGSLALESLALRSLALGSLALDLELRIFGWRSQVRAPQAGGTGLLRLGEPAPDGAILAGTFFSWGDHGGTRPGNIWLQPFKKLSKNPLEISSRYP